MSIRVDWNPSSHFVRFKAQRAAEGRRLTEDQYAPRRYMSHVTQPLPRRTPFSRPWRLSGCALRRNHAICDPAPSRSNLPTWTKRYPLYGQMSISCTPSDVLVRSWLTGQEVRKWFFVAEIVDSVDNVLTTAESMWVKLQALLAPEYMGCAR